MFISKKKAHVHFIGIGGIGMSGIAEILFRLGHQVSGSDLSESANTEKLKSLGIKIYIGHVAENISQETTVVVYSSAVKSDNPEMMKALSLRLPIMKRAEMLAELMRLKLGISVAGTHGKTTTTSLLATILHESGHAPTYIIGGIVQNLRGHAHVGQGNFIVAEADESDGTFLLLNPIMSIITNIDDDHLDHYGTKENLFKAFLDFANKVPFYGLCALNAHDSNILNMLSEIKRPWALFANLDEYTGDTPIQFGAKDVVYSESSTSFNLVIDQKDVGVVETKLIGRHNVLNILASISIAINLGVDTDSIKYAIRKFEGVGRRFQSLHKKGSFEVIDDYGHHPTEIIATLDATKRAKKGKKIIVFFEPHRFSRTRDCWSAFLHSFNLADHVYLAPIYPASEAPIPGITHTILAEDINKLHPGLVTPVSSLDDYSKIFQEYKSVENVTLIALGAGSIGKKIREIVKNEQK